MSQKCLSHVPFKMSPLCINMSQDGIDGNSCLCNKCTATNRNIYTNMKTLKTLSIGFSALTLMFVLANSAHATIELGGPLAGNSWYQQFYQDTPTTSGNPFTHMEFVMTSAGDSWETPGIYSFTPATWSGLLLSTTHLIADGPSVSGSQLCYYWLAFAGAQSNPLTYDIFTYNGTKLLASEHAAYNGSGGWSFTRFDGSSIAPVPTAVPEPTTMIAGALLLLPFGASTLRMLRRRTA